MHEHFYIVESSPGWFQLLVGESLFCLSAGGNLETLYSTLRGYVLKYRTSFRLLKAVHSVEKSYPHSAASFEHKKDLVKTTSLQFSQKIYEVVSEAIGDNKRTSLFAQNRRKKLSARDTYIVEETPPNSKLRPIIPASNCEEISAKKVRKITPVKKVALV